MWLGWWAGWVWVGELAYDVGWDKPLAVADSGGGCEPDEDAVLLLAWCLCPMRAAGGWLLFLLLNSLLNSVMEGHVRAA